MYNIRFIIVALSFLTIVTNHKVNANNGSLIVYNGDSIFLNGINIPWHNFGWDIGTHPQWGSSYDSSFFEQVFTDCENNQVNAIRFWIHCDGRASPEFDSAGYVTGVDPGFYGHLDDLLDRAAQHNVWVILSLWSFDMCENRLNSAGPFAGNHQILIEDSLATESYLINVLEPMVKRYKDHCALLSWEIMNEPEWAMKSTILGGPVVDSLRVSKHHMLRFIGLQAHTIHTYCDKLVTVGSGGLRWSSNQGLSIENLWSDSVLFSHTDSAGAYLDFYQIHFWDWMNFFGNNPFISTPKTWALDKPTLIGEAGVKPINLLLDTLPQTTYDSLWAGLVLWSYQAGDGLGSWSDCQNSLANFGASHDLIYPKCILASTSNQQSTIIRIYPNPVNSVLQIDGNTPLQWLLYNMYGQVIGTGRNSIIDMGIHLPGSYIISIKSENQYYNEVILKLE